MKKQEIYYPSSDGITTIHGIRWEPEEEPIAVLQIIHGMAEYLDRYDRFASYLASNGFLVVGEDHLGHGYSVADESCYGYFAEEDGNGKVIGDIHELFQLTREKYPAKPYFLLGHSMGSFLARQYIVTYGKDFTGVVIMGTAHQPTYVTRAGMMLCQLIRVFKGWKHRSAFIDKLGMGSYNQHFSENPVGIEWLSRSTENATEIRDPKLTGFRFTLNGYYNLFKGLNSATQNANVRKIPKDLPVFFLSGAKDAVGAFGVGVTRVAEQYVKAGIEDVTVKLIPKDRHEVLNEVDRDEVYETLREWFEKNIKKQ